MAWYTTLFIIVFTLFGIKMIISWFCGDIEMDVDLDGINDFDSSSAFSLKGGLHFLLGASFYLFLRSNMAEIDKINAVAQFSTIDYIFAAVCGVILMLALFWAYKIAMKASQTPQNPLEIIDNAKGKIYLNLGNGQYSVEVHTAAGTTNIIAFYSSDDLEPGTEVTLSEEGTQFLIVKEDI